MNTKIVKIDPDDIDNNLIEEAGMIIRQGGLVGFPTETVYGLAADAFNPAAVTRVFDVKGRPLDKPLPVQICDVSVLPMLADDVPECAYQLINAFFPGPLTIILKAASSVSHIITAGTGKVGIRMPDHPVAIDFLKEAETPIVAPSANTSGFSPPVNAQMLMSDLGGKIEYILDAGTTRLMVASTVVDVTESDIRIVRQGIISEEMIINCISRKGG
ncbi:MAG: L-threonylcarbamoyladenylate synthase [Armatimonadota bacterium]